MVASCDICPGCGCGRRGDPEQMGTGSPELRGEEEVDSTDLVCVLDVIHSILLLEVLLGMDPQREAQGMPGSGFGCLPAPRPKPCSPWPIPAPLTPGTMQVYPTQIHRACHRVTTEPHLPPRPPQAVLQPSFESMTPGCLGQGAADKPPPSTVSESPPGSQPAHLTLWGMK